jgi:hypothetical protein
MRRSVTALLRASALAAATCVLGGAAGCGRESFDLLAAAGAAGSSSGTSGVSGSSGAGTSGAGASAGGSLGGSVDAGASAGGQASAGFAGRRNFPEGGSAGFAPCSNGSMCAGSGGGACPASAPFCTPCATSNDCPSDAKNCDKSGRCYQCRRNSDCGVGQACNTLALVCATPCKADDDCSGDANHRVCNTDFDVCVSCMASAQCSLYNNGMNAMSNRCYFSSCVQCAEDRDCGNQYCVAGRCQKSH